MSAHVNLGNETLTALASHPLVRRLAAAFEAAGVPLYLVGGCIRDAFMGIVDFADLDFTTPLDVDGIERIVAPLGTVWDAGKLFGTIGVQITGLKVEITQHRAEAYNPDSRKPTVSFGDRIDLDLARRDLTINAIAIEVRADGTFDVVDPFNGVADITQGRLRTPDDPMRTMSEDPLRQLRVVRFAQRFGFTVDTELADAVRANAHRLSIVSVERIRDELRKVIALGGSAVAGALTDCVDLGIDGFVFGDLVAGDVAGLTGKLAGLGSDDVLAAMAVHAGDGAGSGFARLKLSNAESRPAVASARLVRLLADGEGSDVEARRTIRSHSRDELDRARRVAASCGVVLGPLDGSVRRIEATEPGLRDVPVPVDGCDALAAGLAGKEIGAALARVNEAFLANPDLTRAQATELLSCSDQP